MSNLKQRNQFAQTSFLPFQTTKKIVYSSLKNQKLQNNHRDTSRGFSTNRSVQSDLQHILNVPISNDQQMQRNKKNILFSSYQLNKAENKKYIKRKSKQGNLKEILSTQEFTIPQFQSKNLLIPYKKAKNRKQSNWLWVSFDELLKLPEATKENADNFKLDQIKDTNRHFKQKSDFNMKVVGLLNQSNFQNQQTQNNIKVSKTNTSQLSIHSQRKPIIELPQLELNRQFLLKNKQHRNSIRFRNPIYPMKDVQDELETFRKDFNVTQRTTKKQYQSYSNQQSPRGLYEFTFPSNIQSNRSVLRNHKNINNISSQNSSFDQKGLNQGFKNNLQNVNIQGKGNYEVDGKGSLVSYRQLLDKKQNVKQIQQHQKVNKFMSRIIKLEQAKNQVEKQNKQELKLNQDIQSLVKQNHRKEQQSKFEEVYNQIKFECKKYQPNKEDSVFGDIDMKIIGYQREMNIGRLKKMWQSNLNDKLKKLSIIDSVDL